MLQVINSFRLKIHNAMYFTNIRYNILNNTICNKVIRYCQINAKLMPEFSCIDYL